jgi:hypothetical protein
MIQTTWTAPKLRHILDHIFWSPAKPHEESTESTNSLIVSYLVNSNNLSSRSGKYWSIYSCLMVSVCKNLMGTALQLPLPQP